ncbi:MAG: hypothetical protein QW403_02690 [Candidatus Aenigmatarchaeota archaeon]
MSYEIPTKVASLGDIEIRFVPEGMKIEVWFYEKRPNGRVCWIELKRIKEIKKVYQALKNYGFKLEDEKDFEEKFSKILRKYLEG